MAARVLFIHGMFQTGRSWARWQDRFKKSGIESGAPNWPGRDGQPSALRARPDPRLRTLRLGDVVAQFEALARAEPEPPVLIGHSMGGLVVQILLSRGIGRLGIALNPAPPFGVRSFAFSHLFANRRVLWPGSSPIAPSFEWWRYAFWHTGGDAEVRAAFDAEVVPESRLVGKAPLGPESRVDFRARRPPLLLTAGALDRIIPASLTRKNAAAYEVAASETELHEFAGRTHFLCGQPGWEEVADRCLAFIARRA